jgi:hypothetical protein
VNAPVATTQGVRWVPSIIASEISIGYTENSLRESMSFDVTALPTSCPLPYASYVGMLAQRLPTSIVDITTQRKHPPVPTQASSEFLINKRLGDWGEDLIFRSIRSSTDYIPVKYGRAADTVAGEPGFKKFYKQYQDELDRFGKRPDLLVFRPQDYTRSDHDLSGANEDEIMDLVRNAVLGIEVRSSSYLSKKYRPGESSPFDVLSFTIKVEDIVVVLNWIQNTGVPHLYVQVPFDEVYGLEFHKALEIVLNPANEDKTYAIAEDAKNQFKTTLKIPFTQGIKVGDITESPSFKAVRRDLDSGRLLFYVEFSGGTLTAIPCVWKKIFEQAEQIKHNPPTLQV